MLQTNPERNLLIVTGSPADASRICAYLAVLDTPTPQVTLDVVVMEMSKTAARDWGLDWNYSKGRFGLKLPTVNLGPGQIFYQGVGYLDKAFFATLTALEQCGDVDHPCESAPGGDLQQDGVHEHPPHEVLLLHAGL